MARYTLPFSSVEATLERAGGKGANLAELARAGFAVPPGYVITTDAYREFVRANQFSERLLELARGISPDHLAALDETSAKIRNLFEQGTMPAATAAEVRTEYHRLPSTVQAPAANPLPVAVRSSATAEDLPGLTFAGQQDTYLNVTGEDAVLDAVKRCWGSLWTARALAYRARNNIQPDEVELAVVVQQMVASESSGVLFTANPVTGRRSESVIDASFGLGEAIVSGLVTPDHYVVNTRAWKITECVLGEKSVAVIPRAGGGTEQVGQENAQRQALPDEQIIELARTGQRVAGHFGSPQDIEWAWAEQRLVLLQSRPITSLYPLPASDHPDDDLHVYVNFNAIQGVTDPITPMGMDAMRLLFGGVPKLLRLQSSMRQLLPEAGGRLFMDMTGLVRDPRLRQVVPNLLAQTDPAARQTLQRLIAEGQIPPKQVLTFRRAVTLVLALLPIFRHIFGAMLAPEKVYPRTIATAEEFIARVQANAQATHDLAGRLRSMRDDLAGAEETFLAVIPTVLPVLGAVSSLDRWLVEWLGEKPGAALQLLRGLPNNVTTEMDLKLWAAAQRIRSDAAALESLRSRPVETLVEDYGHRRLPVTAQRSLEEFLQKYGMRAVGEIDIGHPRWRDDPTPILQTLRGYLELEDPDRAPDVVFQRNRGQAERLAADYIARIRRTRFGWLRARIVGGIIRRMRALSGLREIPLFYMVRTLDLYRTAWLDGARELVAQGELESNEDIFFVPIDQLDQLADGQAIHIKDMVAVYRAGYERERMRRQMPHILFSTGEAFYEGVGAADAGDNSLAGEAVSPGVVEGRAHVLLNPRAARLEPGEILVCPSTDPGWTPLFLTAAGLVMEIGGMITHGSVVAREYGIPAVVGVHQATTRIETGRRVRVDGNRGRVTILD